MSAATATAPRSVDLPIDAEGAYAFLTDLDYLPEWYPGLTDITGASGDTPQRGARFTEHRRMAPGVSVPIGLTVTESVPGRSFHVAAERHGVGRLEGRYDITPLTKHTSRVTVSHSIEPSSAVYAPAVLALRAVLARGDRNQIAAMPRGLARWRGDIDSA